MLKLVLGSVCVWSVAGWNHIASLNADCGGEISLLRGTEAETTIALGKLPYQAKLAFQEVIKARVAAEGCTLTPQQQELFYGLEAINVLRLVDSYDTELNNTAFPCRNVGNLKWNWQSTKHAMQGIQLPSSCRSADFATSKQCRAKFRVADNLFVEAHFADTCTNPSQAGYGLPQLTLTCSGSMCASFGMPCVPGVTTCAGGATCYSFDDFTPSGIYRLLVDGGLFAPGDAAGCSSGGSSFEEQFFSDAINHLAQGFGLTSTLSTARYSSLSLCGVGEVTGKLFPTRAPTPSGPRFVCHSDGFTIPLSQVCDGVNHCSTGDDEMLCRCNSTNPGMIDSSTGTTYSCCDVCAGYSPPCYSTYCSYNYPYYQNRLPLVICNQTAWGLSCPDLVASSGPLTVPAASPLKYAQSANANQHLLGALDCEGNLQVGSSDTLFMINAKLPVKQVAAHIEALLKEREPCRLGTAVSDWKRYFFPWAVNFWGGALFTTQSDANIFNNANPGVMWDDFFRYYGPRWPSSAPWANVYNPPASCNEASTTGGGVCEVGLRIDDWFAGDSPLGWNSTATTLRAKGASTCAGSSAAQGVATCEGPCSSTKSGCCMLTQAVLPPVGYACPAGYKLERLESWLTDFLFRPATSQSRDTSLMNFAMLVATRSTGFGSGPGQTPFVPPSGNNQICILKSLDTNMADWGERAVRAQCPYAPAPPNSSLPRSCPQVLPGGGIESCVGCVQMPAMVACPPSGCPSSTTTSGAPVRGTFVALLAPLGAALVIF